MMVFNQIMRRFSHSVKSARLFRVQDCIVRNYWISNSVSFDWHDFTIQRIGIGTLLYIFAAELQIAFLKSMHADLAASLTNYFTASQIVRSISSHPYLVHSAVPFFQLDKHTRQSEDCILLLLSIYIHSRSQLPRIPLDTLQWQNFQAFTFNAFQSSQRDIVCIQFIRRRVSRAKSQSFGGRAWSPLFCFNAVCTFQPGLEMHLAVGTTSAQM